MNHQSTGSTLTTLQNTPLSTLIDQCQEQMVQYKQRNLGESLSCTEIVKRAAEQDAAALGALLHLSETIVRARCPKAVRGLVDDVVQEVNLRLVRKFRSVEHPYQPTHFAAYHAYLNLTLRSVVLNLLERDQTTLSLDQIEETSGAGPALASPAGMVEKGLLLQTLLNYLPNPLEREALYRRYVLQETPDEVAVALQPLDPTLTKQQVYRLIERGLRRLVEHPLVQQMRLEL